MTVHRSVTMRVMAEKYEWLAKTAANPAERQRFSDYAKLYREMELHFVEVEKPVWDKFATTPEMKSLVQEIVNTK